MAIFTVTNDKAQFTNVSAGTDNYVGGIRMATNGAANANGTYTSGGSWCNGLQFNPSGSLCVADTSAGLPIYNVTLNGLKFDVNGSVCITTGAVNTYNNGLPMDVNGSLCVNAIP